MKYYVDETDKKILEMLKRNARTPYTYIAKELNLSEAAIRKRINRLIRYRIIRRFTIEYSLENEIRAVVLIKVLPQHSTPDISAKIARLHGVDHVYEITGDYDILVVLRGDSITALNNIVDEIRSIRGVGDTNTMIVLNVRL